jgi:hypothetical protein
MVASAQGNGTKPSLQDCRGRRYAHVVFGFRVRSVLSLQCRNIMGATPYMSPDLNALFV